LSINLVVDSPECISLWILGKVQIEFGSNSGWNQKAVYKSETKCKGINVLPSLLFKTELHYIHSLLSVTLYSVFHFTRKREFYFIIMAMAYHVLLQMGKYGFLIRYLVVSRSEWVERLLPV
jgi:hypothetical protein